MKWKNRFFLLLCVVAAYIFFRRRLRDCLNVFHLSIYNSPIFISNVVACRRRCFLFIFFIFVIWSDSALAEKRNAWHSVRKWIRIRIRTEMKKKKEEFSSQWETKLVFDWRSVDYETKEKCRNYLNECCLIWTRQSLDKCVWIRPNFIQFITGKNCNFFAIVVVVVVVVVETNVFTNVKCAPTAKFIQLRVFSFIQRNGALSYFLSHV